MAVGLLLTATLVLATGTLGHRSAVPFQDHRLSSGSLPTCRYEFVLQNQLDTSCMYHNTELSNKIEIVQADIEHNRLRYISQNLIIQEQIVKAEKTSQGYESHMDDLRNSLVQIRNHLSNASPSSGGKSKDVRRLVQQTNYSFKKVMTDMENRLVKIANNIQKDAVVQSKVNAAVELQIRTQDEKSTKAETQVKDLMTTIKDLEKKSTGRSMNPGAEALRRIQDKVKQFEDAIITVDRLQQKQFLELQEKDNTLFLQFSNNSYEMRNIEQGYSNLLSKLYSTEQQTDEISVNFARLQSTSETKFNRLDKVLNNVNNEAITIRSQIQSVSVNAMNSSVTVNQDRKNMLQLSGNLDNVTTKITNVLTKMDKQASAISRVSKELSSLSITLNPAQVQMVNLIIRNLQSSASIDSELHQVMKEITNLNTILAGLKKPPSTVFKIPTLLPGSAITAGLAVPSNPVPGSFSTSNSPTRTPTSSTTLKATFRIPPTFASVGTPKVGTTSDPSSSSPTQAHTSSTTSKITFKIPPTFGPVGSPKVGTTLGPRSSSFKTVFKVPTFAPTTAMKIPTQMHVSYSTPKTTLKTPMLTPVPPSIIKAPTFPSIATPTAKFSFNIPTLVPKPSLTTKLDAPTFKPINVPNPPFKSPPFPATISTSGIFRVPPVPTPIRPQVLGPKFPAGKK